MTEAKGVESRGGVGRARQDPSKERRGELLTTTHIHWAERESRPFRSIGQERKLLEVAPSRGGNGTERFPSVQNAWLAYPGLTRGPQHATRHGVSIIPTWDLVEQWAKLETPHKGSFRVNIFDRTLVGLKLGVKSKYSY